MILVHCMLFNSFFLLLRSAMLAFGIRLGRRWNDATSTNHQTMASLSSLPISCNFYNPSNTILNRCGTDSYYSHKLASQTSAGPSQQKPPAIEPPVLVKRGKKRYKKKRATACPKQQSVHRPSQSGCAAEPFASRRRWISLVFG
ncbi:hypothetical protein V8C34DRAFT_80563 [Trichoderma compactum]